MCHFFVAVIDFTLVVRSPKETMRRQPTTSCRPPRWCCRLASNKSTLPLVGVLVMVLTLRPFMRSVGGGLDYGILAVDYFGPPVPHDNGQNPRVATVGGRRPPSGAAALVRSRVTQLGAHREHLGWNLTQRARLVDISKEDLKRWKEIGDDIHDNRHVVDTTGDDMDCVLMSEWQESSFPTCNLIHETDRTLRAWASQQWKYLNYGAYNSVYSFVDHEGTEYVHKQIKENRDLRRFALESVRMDALVMERLTSSPFVINIYGYCGLSTVVPMSYSQIPGQGRQLGSIIFDPKRKLTMEEKMHLAVRVASALSAIENMNGDGVAPFVNLDYMVKQHLMVDGEIRLSDFNKGIWVAKDQNTNKPCPFRFPSCDNVSETLFG